jgi:hypothetical protein
MSNSDPTPAPAKGDSRLALSIMFFSVAVLFFMLGWADGVRHDRSYMHIPETGGWMVAGIIMVGVGIGFLLWSRSAKRS